MELPRYILLLHSVLLFSLHLFCMNSVHAQTSSYDFESWEPNLENAIYSKNDPVVRYSDIDLNMLDLSYLADIRRLPQQVYGTGFNVRKFRGDDLEFLTVYLASWIEMAGKAKEEGYTVSDEEAASLVGPIQRFEGRYLQEIYIDPMIEEPARSDIAAIYEELKENDYKVKESLRMGVLTMPFYDVYTTTETVKIEEILNRHELSSDSANDILYYETRKPVLENQAKNQRDQNGHIDRGTKLLVPIPEDARKAIKERSQAAYSELEKGKSWEEVVAKYQSDLAPARVARFIPEELSKPINPNILEVFHSLEDDSYSQPFTTKRGESILYRKEYIPEGYETYEETESRNRLVYTNRQKMKAQKEFFKEILANEKVVVVNEDILEAESIADDAVLLEILGIPLTYSDLSEGISEKKLDVLDKQILFDVVAENRRAQGVLYRGFLEHVDPELGEKFSWLRSVRLDFLIANKYIDELVDQRLSEADQEMDAGQEREFRYQEVLKVLESFASEAAPKVEVLLSE